MCEAQSCRGVLLRLTCLPDGSDALQKKLDETSKELTQAKQQVGEYQSHRYQMFREGYRTWRLDTVRGSSCIMLTVQNDWNKPETNRQSCACEDLFKENPAPLYEPKKLYKCVP